MQCGPFQSLIPHGLSQAGIFSTSVYDLAGVSSLLTEGMDGEEPQGPDVI